mmetsp:Transcript_3390/g.5918  ORF Transcript_3390/g.5918 Transcript_3390/m.5918 type:complete len:182 (-) Transcript_3390:341-886(-)
MIRVGRLRHGGHGVCRGGEAGRSGGALGRVGRGLAPRVIRHGGLVEAHIVRAAFHSENWSEKTAGRGEGHREGKAEETDRGHYILLSLACSSASWRLIASNSSEGVASSSGAVLGLCAVLVAPPVMALKKASCCARIASNPGIFAIGLIAAMLSMIVLWPSFSISKLEARNSGTTEWAWVV